MYSIVFVIIVIIFFQWADVLTLQAVSIFLVVKSHYNSDNIQSTQKVGTCSSVENESSSNSLQTNEHKTLNNSFHGGVELIEISKVTP